MMQILKLVPRGNVEKDVNWGIRTISFENGTNQYQRIWQEPRVTYSFSTQGGLAMKEYLQEFFNSVCANFIPFYWEYENELIPVRFGETNLSFTEIRGYAGMGVVGYSVNVSLVKCKKGEWKEA